MIYDLNAPSMIFDFNAQLPSYTDDIAYEYIKCWFGIYSKLIFAVIVSADAPSSISAMPSFGPFY